MAHCMQTCESQVRAHAMHRQGRPRLAARPAKTRLATFCSRARGSGREPPASPAEDGPAVVAHLGHGRDTYRR